MIDSSKWGYNGNPEAPTITPSILVHPHKRFEHPDQPRCHSFVTDGKIMFLEDSQHPLAGQTVDLPDWVE